MGNHHIGLVLSEDKPLDIKVINALASSSRYDSKSNFIKKAIVFYSEYKSSDISQKTGVEPDRSFDDMMKDMNNMLSWMQNHLADGGSVAEKKPKSRKEPVSKPVKEPVGEDTEDNAVNQAEETPKAAEKTSKKSKSGADTPVKAPEVSTEEPVKEPEKTPVTDVSTEDTEEENDIKVDDDFFADFLDQ